jgi:REP element-mobilizing transposase RayT
MHARSSSLRRSRPGRTGLSRQLTLDHARRPTGRGGWRPGAGRPRSPGAVSHRAREAFAPRFPQHVTLRVRAGVPSLRRGATVALIRQIVSAAGRADFAVVELNVLGNHLHLLVEADGAAALSRGMQGLGVRLARRINAHLARRGALFDERYHARSLRTPREVRDALRYVLLNARHHAAERGRRLAAGWLDPYSTAPWFDGFAASPDRRSLMSPPWLTYLRSLPRPTAPPRTWLLATGWRRHGLLAPDDIPGGPRTRRRPRRASDAATARRSPRLPG